MMLGCLDCVWERVFCNNDVVGKNVVVFGQREDAKRRCCLRDGKSAIVKWDIMKGTKKKGKFRS